MLTTTRRTSCYNDNGLLLFFLRISILTTVCCHSLSLLNDRLYIEEDEPVVRNIRVKPPQDDYRNSRDGRQFQFSGDLTNKSSRSYNRITLVDILNGEKNHPLSPIQDASDNDMFTTEKSEYDYDEYTDFVLRLKSKNNSKNVLAKVDEEANYNVESKNSISYKGAQVIKFKLVNFNVLPELNYLNLKKEIGWWGGNKQEIDVMVKPTSRDYVYELFQNHSVPYEIIINDLQSAIDSENPVVDEELEFANRKGHRMTWSSYHRLTDIHGYLDYLANTYPELCSVQTIGQSVRGNQLKVLKISNGNPSNKAIWIDGGIHAREWISPASVTYIINQLVDNFENESPEIKNVDWYFHPVANPDGYEYTHTGDRLWRKNLAKINPFCSGVDLNRNFGYRWGGRGSSKNPCTETYAGKYAFSEPESAAIKDFFENANAKFKAYLSFHSYGQYILYPWGYANVVPPDHADLDNVGQRMAQIELEETKSKLTNETTFHHTSKTSDKTLQIQLDQALENLKDLQEHNTALQLQLDTLNKSHQLLKACSEELTTANNSLERKLIENEALIARLKNELKTLQEKYNLAQNTEQLLKKSIEHEKTQNKSLKLQTEKDSKSIQDLTRQVKEMERIMTRKHPDSVSALILAANANNATDTNNLSARQILEERIKQLENEAKERDMHSTKIFADVQDKFNTMKQKYESHIDDLENHVAELKSQLNRNLELIDEETQTYLDTNQNISYVEVAVQTIANKIPKLKRSTEKLTGSSKEDAHLLATIRGLNQDIATKERTMLKLQKEMEELKKTNRRLQKERETALRTCGVGQKNGDLKYNPNEYRIDYDSAIVDNAGNLENMNIQYGLIRDEKEKLKLQLSRLEEDYQMLKLKRLQDLNTLQEAHEQELTNYMGKMAPLREQLEVQQVTIKKLQQQLASAREQVAVLTVERDHLETKLKSLRHLERELEENDRDNNGVSEYTILRRKITQLERRYEERELRLRAIVQGLAQKQSTMNSARDCEQCAIRQQQLCSYKAELDQVLSTLRNHTNL